jgi:hypothetical protein
MSIKSFAIPVIASRNGPRPILPALEIDLLFGRSHTCLTVGDYEVLQAVSFSSRFPACATVSFLEFDGMGSEHETISN